MSYGRGRNEPEGKGQRGGHRAPYWTVHGSASRHKTIKSCTYIKQKRWDTRLSITAGGGLTQPKVAEAPIVGKKKRGETKGVSIRGTGGDSK